VKKALNKILQLKNFKNNASKYFKSVEHERKIAVKNGQFYCRSGTKKCRKTEGVLIVQPNQNGPNK